MKIKEIKSNQVNWTNIENPDKGLVLLREKYKFHPLDIEDCLTKSQRAKVDIYDNYIFMVLLLPVYNDKTHEIEPEEVDFFIGNNYLITVHNGHLPKIKELFHICEINMELRNKYFVTPENILYEILNKLFTARFPMLDHVSEDVDEIEKKIFNGYQKKMVKEISETRRNITDFRKISQSHKKAVQRLTMALKAGEIYSMKQTDVYYDNLIDHTKEIWDVLENLKERIEALQETNESLISFRINDIIRILTVISVIMLPITLIGTIFGMNFRYLPWVFDPAGFWYASGIIAITGLALVWYFRKKDWL